MKMLKHIMIVSIALFAITSLFPQSINKLEAEQRSLNKQLDFHRNSLDSLEIIYQARIEEIDDEKSKTEKDEDKIAQLMSRTISLTYQIDLEHDRIENVESNLRMVKGKLNNLYEHQIDSLKMLEASANYSGNKDLLSMQILHLMEKKLSDGINTNKLSYDPALLLGLDNKAIRNGREKDIYTDYLENASSEVNGKIEFIADVINELEETNRLHKKVDKFIKDAEFESNPLTAQLSDEYLNERVDLGGGVFDHGTLERNFESYSFLYNQLSIQQFMHDRNIEWNSDYTLSKNDLSAQAFIDLLKEINLRLENYNSLLKDKLSEFDNADN